MKDFSKDTKQKKPHRASRRTQRIFFEDGFDENYVGDEKDEQYLNALTQLERERVFGNRHKARDDFERKKKMRSFLVNEKSNLQTKIDPKARKLRKSDLTKNRLGKLADDEIELETFDKEEINPDMVQFSEDSNDEGFSDSESKSESEISIRYKRVEKPANHSDSDYEPSLEKKKRKRIKKLRDDKKSKKNKKNRSQRNQQRQERTNKIHDRYNRKPQSISAAKHYGDLNKICVKRDFLARMTNHPHLEKTLFGCLVKVNYKNSYRVGLISQIIAKPDKPYQLAGKEHYKYLNVYFDAKEHNVQVRVANVSNRPIDESEAFKLLIELADFNDIALNLKWIQSKKSDLLDMLNFKLTVKEIDQMNEDKLKNTNQQNLGLFERIQLLEKKLSTLEHMNIDLFSGKRLTKIKAIKRQIDKLKRLKKQEIQQKKILMGKKSTFNNFMKYEQLGQEKRKFCLRTRSKPVNLWALKEEDVRALKLHDHTKGKSNKQNKEELRKKRKISTENIIQIYHNYESSLRHFKNVFADTSKFDSFVDKWPECDYQVPNL